MNMYRKAIDHTTDAERHFAEVRARSHDGLLFYLSTGMDTRMKFDTKSPMLRTTGIENGIDCRLLRGTQLLDDWLIELQTTIENSLRGRGYEFDSTELSIDWPSNDAPERAKFILVARRTIPQLPVPWYRRVLGMHA